jgi:hypothetical protein
MREPTQVVKGGPHGRPAGTEAKRRPLTTGHTTTATMDNAPPTGRGPQAHGAARSAAHKNQFGATLVVLDTDYAFSCPSLTAKKHRALELRARRHRGEANAAAPPPTH